MAYLDQAKQIDSERVPKCPAIYEGTREIEGLVVARSVLGLAEHSLAQG